MAYKVKYEKVLPRTVLPLEKRHWKEIGQIVRIEVGAGIDEQVQVDGSPYAPLKPKTIERKRKKGSPEPTKRLVDTTNLRRNQAVTPSVDRVEVAIGPTRSAIGYYQQEEPGEGNVPTAFFGISQNCSNRILVYVDGLVKKWLSQKS